MAGRPAAYLEGRCLSFGGGIPYLPLQDIIRESCGIVDTDTPAEIAEKVGLSSSPAWRRIGRLKKAKVIVGQVTLLDQDNLGLTFSYKSTASDDAPDDLQMDVFMISLVSGWHPIIEGSKRLKSE